MAVAESSTETTPDSQENTFNLDKLIDNFFIDMENRFLEEFIGANIVELFHQEIENFPEFFI